MDQATRNQLRLAVSQCRRILEPALREELEGRFGIRLERARRLHIEPEARLKHLTPQELQARRDLLDYLAHAQARGFAPADALEQLVREVAFTHLNRLCAYKMMEVHQVYVGGQRFREAVSRGVYSEGFQLYLAEHPEAHRAVLCGPARTRLPPFPRLAGAAAGGRDRRALQSARSGQSAVSAAAGSRPGARLSQRPRLGRRLAP
ncbi:MAG: hypothetical protein RMI91_00255 [Gemmatales bacterium]|nr:BREX-1 system adenine-specific DNA-methyltransferase PglX [Gemmatales bacterium]MDW7993062.1 hypothetical protein [Gemmatales bacterium]